jgi:hypothetical protein
MKFIKKVLLTAALVSMFFLGVHVARPHHNPTFRLTPERAATHAIRYYTHVGKEVGSCTGVAIGPHAILTAGHCNEGADATEHIQLDYSMHYYKILMIITDGQDHDVYILDGPAFKNFVLVRQREAKTDEAIISYGTGGQDWPPHTYLGKVETDLNGGDQSDVDAAEGIHAFSIPVVPGDSGSAIYGSDGSIVALASWANAYDDGSHAEAAGAALAFSPKFYQEMRDLKETVDNGNNDSAHPNGQP